MSQLFLAKSSQKGKLRKGLSLVEIVAVIAIVAIIALVAINRFAAVNEAARVATLESSFTTVRTAAMLHGAQTGGQLPQNYSDIVRHIQNIDPPAGGGVWDDTNYVAAGAELHALFAAIGGASGPTNPGPNPVDIVVVFPNSGNNYRMTFTATISNLENDYGARVGTSTQVNPGEYTYQLQFVLP